MNFWQRLRLIASLIVLTISVVAIVLAVLRAPDLERDPPSGHTDSTPKPQSATTGL